MAVEKEERVTFGDIAWENDFALGSVGTSPSFFASSKVPIMFKVRSTRRFAGSFEYEYFLDDVSRGKGTITTNFRQPLNDPLEEFRVMRLPSMVAGAAIPDSLDVSRSALGPFKVKIALLRDCLLYTSPSPRDRQKSRMPSSA